MSEKFIPKKGEMIQVSEKDDFSDCSFLRNNGEREFICFTKNNEYYVVHTVKGTGVAKYEFALPIDKHKELKECVAIGAKIESKLNDGSVWFNDTRSVMFEDDREYRIKGGISIDAFKKHYKTIIAFWSGAYVQIFDGADWITINDAFIEFIADNEYRPYLPKGSIVEVIEDGKKYLFYTTGTVEKKAIEVFEYGCDSGRIAYINNANFKVIKYAE